jgi:glycogen debranching enzyme
MKYLNLLGMEPVPVQSVTTSLVDEGYGRKAGLHSFRSHPVFEGLHGGATIYFPVKDEPCRQNGFFGPTVPAGGKVIAVDWSYIVIHDHSKLMAEYDFGHGKVMAIGAYTIFDGTNLCRQQLEYFMTNVFHSLINSHPAEKAHYWNYNTCKILPFIFQDLSYAAPVTPVSFPPAVAWPDTLEAMTLEQRFATDNLWDVATPRMLVMGTEKGGIEELWAHPFMALRDYEAGIQFTGRDTIFWLNKLRPEVEMHPGSFKRTYRLSACYLTETITAGINDPVCIIHYDYKGLYPAKLIYRFRSNFRFMWPYGEEALGSLRCSRDTTLNAFILSDTVGEFVCLVGANKITVGNGIGQYSTFTGSDATVTGVPTDDFIVTAQASADLEMNDCLDVVIAASCDGIKNVVDAYRSVLSDPLSLYRATVTYTQHVLSNSLMISTPDAVFNEGYRWAVTATDRFFVRTPDIGSSLVAGYSTTRYGWDGGQTVSGRPGYAWYFGRDGEWSGMALLDEGDFEKVKQMLELYQSYQDITGKIFHELTTSGVVHYDAADATPLYIILAGKYLRHSGDIDFIRKSWGNIKKAIDFCFSTDTDGDHLIENTNVGHGWVEGGHLYGTQTTLYLASCWAEALEEAAYMAEQLNRRQKKGDRIPEAAKYEKEACIVKNMMDDSFWNADNNYFYDGKYRDGTYLAEPTIQASIPLYFKQSGKEHADAVLMRIAGNRFTTDWGARIIGDDSPFFNPNGYHEGSVWPLFTGWAALAEYSNGNYVQGYAHIMNNLQDYQFWSRGFINEVLNGQVYKPSGVCPHQCWSETMVLQPVIEGLLGLEVSAPDHSLMLSPHFPFDWDNATVTHIRIGDQYVDFDLHRKDNETIYTFQKTGNEPLNVDFSPSFPPGWSLKSLLVNNDPGDVTVNHENQAETVHISFQLNDTYSIVITGLGGAGILPVVAQPKPGCTSDGFRIIDCWLNERNYRIILEGKNHTSGKFKIYLPDQKLGEIVNGELLETTGAISTIGVTFDACEGRYVTKEILISLAE